MKSRLYILPILCVLCSLPRFSRAVNDSLPEVLKAESYFDLGRIHEGISELKKGLERVKDDLEEENESLADLYFRLSEASFNKGDYLAERMYSRESLRIYLLIKGESHERVHEIRYNTGLNFVETGDLKKGMPLLEQALSGFLGLLGEQNEQVSKCYTAIGFGYRASGQYELAFEYLARGLKIQRQVFGETHEETATTYHIIGYTHLYRGDYPNALIFLNKAYEIRKKVWGFASVNTSRSLVKLGECQFYMGNYLKAVQYQQWAIDAISGREPSQNLFGDPNLESPILSIRHLLAPLQYKASAWNYYSTTVDSPEVYLKYALHNFELALEVTRKIQTGISSDESKQIITNTFIANYENAINVAYSLFQKTGERKWLIKAFEYSEQSKGLSLRLSQNDRSAAEMAEVPDSLVQIRARLARKTTALESRIESEKDNDILRTNLLNTRIELGRHIAFLEAEFPKYRKLKYETEVVSMDSVQYGLEEGELLIEYYLGKYFLIHFSIRKDTAIMGLRLIPKGLQSSGNRFMHALSAPAYFVDSTTRAYHDLVQEGHKLYRDLVQPALISDQPLDSLSKLTIVTDGWLSLLPFGLFVLDSNKTQRPDFKQIDYLIKKVPVCFAASATLLARQRMENPVPPKYPFYSFGISYQEMENGPGVLFKAREEAIGLAKLFQGKYYAAPSVSKDSLLGIMGQSGILHFAMHTYLNPESGSYALMLGGGKNNEYLLSIGDLYSLNIPARLVVLSACESGVGAVLEGEGLASLSRGFQYAGAQSIMLSLWQAEDKSTLRLMEGFYSGMLDGLPKDQALQKAQLAFLKEEAEPLTAHPFYWGSFILSGDSAPVDGGNKIPWGIILLLILAGMIGYKEIRKI